MRVGIIGAMSGNGRPRVAITGIGVVSPYGVGRDCFWRHVSRGCSATRSIVDFDASPFPCTVAAPVPPVTIDDARDADRAGRATRPPAGRADPRRYSKASLIAVIAAREAWADAGLRLNEPDAGVLVGSGAGGIDVAERQYARVLHRRLEARHAVRDPGLDRRHDLERDLDRARAARHQPRRVDRLHQLDRCHRATPRR